MAAATATATATAMSRLFSLTTTTTKSTLSTLTFRRTTTTPSLSLRRNIHHHAHHRRRRFSTTISAAISAGDKLPDATFSYLDAENNVQTLTTSDITAAKTAVIFAVPGAFTPTCSQKHVPSFIQHSASLKSKGVSVIACVAVNDAFVMKAWKDSLGVTDDSVLFLCDVNGEFTKSIGAELDLTDKPIGLGVRSRRYAMLVDDGVAKAVNMEEGGAFTFSSAEDILKLL